MTSMNDLQREMAKLFFRTDIKPSDILQTQLLKRRYFPKALYKYRSCTTYALENLKTSTIYCTTANTFNDPYDSAINFATPGISDLPEIEDQLQEIDTSNPELREAIREFLRARELENNHQLVEDFNKFAQSAYKICSFSERVDSLLMWGHYGQNHTGFAMEYDFASLPPKDIMSLSLWPVFYGDKIFDISEFVNSGMQAGFNNLYMIASAMHKAADWAYEHEWRVVIADGPAFVSRNMLAPLKAVHLGSKISDLDEQAIVEIAKQINIPVYKMRLSRHEFKMESVSIDKVP